MAITQLDRIAALIVVDLQKGVVALPTFQPSSEIVSRSAKLAQAFRKRRWPVVLVNVKPGPPSRTQSGIPTRDLPPDWAELVPELEQKPGDYLVTKSKVSAFIGTPLDEYLRQQGVLQTVVAGIATSVGVEMTGRSAYDFGYNVVYVVDAMTDLNPEAHRYCVENVFPRFGETDTTDNVLQMLGVALAQ